MTDAEELALVEAAIQQILASGQEIEGGNTRLRMPELDRLTKRRDMLTARIARATQGRGGIRVRGAVPL